jgi:hypothetical protein
MLVHKKTAKKYMRYFFNLIHYSIVAFITLGAFLPKKYLFYFIFAWPLMILHWKTNNDKCFITELECWLDKQPYCDRSDNEYPFVTHLLSFFNIKITDKKTKNNIIMYGLTFFWLIGMGRYYKVL